MQVYETGFPGLLVLEPRVFQDERGFFLESYSKNVFENVGINCDFVQDNQAYSRKKGVLRGFHFQRPPMAQAKMVWVVKGAVVDVVVDLRLGSPTYGQHYSVKLSAANFKRMFIPQGFAHAYITVSDETEFLYKVDAPYSPKHEGGIVWKDSHVGMDWESVLEGQSPILSEKDLRLSGLADFESPFVFEG